MGQIDLLKIQNQIGKTPFLVAAKAMCEAEQPDTKMVWKVFRHFAGMLSFEIPKGLIKYHRNYRQ